MELGHTTKKILAQLFEAIAEQETQVERERLELADRASFEPFQSFKRIDRYSNGCIDESDLRAF
jgi:hypothetical protein